MGDITSGRYSANIVEAKNSSDENELILNNKWIYEYYKLCKSIIHDLRCNCDMLLYLTSRMKKNGMKISSIGKYRSGKNGCYDYYCAFFKKLAKLDNSIKHSYTNDLIKEFNCAEPYYCVCCSKNWSWKNYYIIFEPISDLVVEFNGFYSYVIKYLKETNI